MANGSDPRPCGCAYHRGASAVVGPDCCERTPEERAAYVASFTRGIVPPGTPVYVSGVPFPVHAYASGARPIRKGA